MIHRSPAQPLKHAHTLSINLRTYPSQQKTRWIVGAVGCHRAEAENLEGRGGGELEPPTFLIRGVEVS